MAIPSLIICFLFYYIRKFYLRTSSDVKRLESIGNTTQIHILGPGHTWYKNDWWPIIWYLNFYIKSARSPIFAHINTSLHGLPTIRAFRAQETLTNQVLAFQDVHTATFYFYIASAQWITIVLDWIAALYFMILVISFWVVFAGNFIQLFSSSIFIYFKYTIQ